MVQLKRTIAILLAVITLLAVLPITALGGVTDPNGNTVSSINILTKAKGTETVKEYTVNYTNYDRISVDDTSAGVVIPVTANHAGTLFIKYRIDTLGSSSCTVRLYKDSSFQTSIDYFYLYPDKLDGTAELTVPKKGTYYLVFYSYSSTYTTPYTNKINFKPYIIGNHNRTLTANTWAAATYNSEYTYYKIVVPKLRVVTLQTNSDKINISLTDSKKVLKQDYDTTLDADNGFKASYALTKGTYYIRTRGSSVDTYYKIRYTLSGYPTLTAGKYTKFSQACGKMNMYVKFKATASGYATIKTSKGFYGYLTLCNSSMKAISPQVYVSSSGSDKAIFGVTKGTTYYVRINDNSGMTSSITFTNKAVADKSGSTRAKAKAIYTGNTYKGYIAAAKNVKDWYKFTLSSPKYWAIDFKGYVNDDFTVSVYNSNGKLLSSHYYYGGDRRLYSYDDYPKGTYYVCIARKTTKDSGYYSINLKTANKCLG